MNEYINPTGDERGVQCSICGWWVPKGKHTWLECASLVRLSGRLHIFLDDKARQPVPSGFYRAFGEEPPHE